MSGNIYAWILLAGYVVFLFYFALRGRQHTSTIEQYSVFRGLTHPVVLGISYTATTVSAIVFLGFPGWIYTGGYSGLWTSFGVWGFFVISALLLAKGIRRLGMRYGSLTIPDLLGHMYNSEASRIVFAGVFLVNIVYVASVFIGIALLLSAVLGIPYLAAIIGVTVVSVGYVILGGTYAQVFSDFWMGIIMAFAAVALFSVGFWAIDGGWAGMTRELAATDPNLVAPFNPDFALFASPLAILAISFVSLFFGVQSQLGKFFLGMSRERDIRTFTITVVIFYSLFYLVIISGVYARVLYPNIQPDQAVPTLINDLFHPAIGAVMLIALVAASVSTFNTLFVQMGTVIGNDVYRRSMVTRGWLAPRNQEDLGRVTLRVTRAVSIIVGLIALLIAINPPQYLGTLGSVGVFGVISGTAAPLLLGIYWSRATASGAIAAGIVGPALFLVLTVTQTIPSVWVAGSIGVLTGFVLMLAVGLMSPVPASAGREDPRHTEKLEATATPEQE